MCFLLLSDMDIAIVKNCTQLRAWVHCIKFVVRKPVKEGSNNHQYIIRI